MLLMGITYLHCVHKNFQYACKVHETKGVVVPKVQTADNCFGLIGPRQCSAALDGPATSDSRPKAPWDLKGKGASNHL